MLTQKKIAEALGLSCATVTNILNRKPGLRYSQATRDKVLETAEAMGYQPNRSWQTIRKGRSNLIGVITLGIEQELTRKATYLLPLAINAAGYDYMVIDLHWCGGRIERVIEELVKMRAEGVIVTFMKENFRGAYIDQLKRAGIPIVAIDGNTSFGIPVIQNDFQNAFQQIGRHLLDLDHRQLLMVAGSSKTAAPVLGREEGIKQAMQGVGPVSVVDETAFPEHWERQTLKRAQEPSATIVHVDHKPYGHNPTKALYEFSSKLFRSGQLPDALICSNDAAAFGVFWAALEYGVSIPGDMALTGADNDANGAMPAFGLTTVNFNIEAACTMAIETLMHCIAERKNPAAVIEGRCIGAELILRTSSLKKKPAALPQYRARQD